MNRGSPPEKEATRLAGRDAKSGKIDSSKLLDSETRSNKSKPKDARIYFMVGRRPVTEFPDHALFVSTKPVTIEGVPHNVEVWFTFRGAVPEFMVGRLIKKEGQA
jgi:hypothetical protein